MTELRCARCGAAIGPGALFCMKCGADVSGDQANIATRVVGGAGPTGVVPRMSQADLLARLRNATLGDYEILAELGRGGMATVYLAHDIQLDRKVAIKVLNPGVARGQGMIERFRLEARTAAKLSHPNIIPIHAVRETDALVFFVMKFVVGRALDTIIRQLAPLPVPTVRTILTKVAEALGYAHRHGVVHRDIKPANIMIDAEGMPIVTDFGIAKVVDHERLTMTGTAIGTPTYMSPEQCDAGTITGASDQYSLGVMGYEMLTGRPLYDSENFVTIMFKHCHDPPPTADSFGAGVPADLALAIVRMLQKAPSDRWPTMEDALPALRGSDASLDDAVRTQMIELAKGGTKAELLARLSTPRSPIPVIGAGAPTPSPGEAPSVRAPIAGALRARRRVLAGAAVALMAVAGTLAVLRPWRAADRAQGPGPAPDTTIVPAPQPLQATALPTADSAPAVPPADTAAAAAPAAPTVRDLRILDAPSTVAEGQTASLRAQILDQQGRPIARPIRWSSSDPSVASIGADGQLLALTAGPATLTAEADGRRAQAAIIVTPVVATVLVVPDAGELRPGDALALSATPRGRDGQPVPDRQVTWRSSDERVAVVSSAGRVTAVGAGTTVVSATSEGQTGTARITVPAPSVASPPVEAPPPTVVQSPQELISGVVLAYARALESKDLARVKALHPGITPSLERRTRDALEAMEDLRVHLVPSDITVSGATARARVTGAWTYRGGRLDVSSEYVFERRGADWVIVATN